MADGLKLSSFDSITLGLKTFSTMRGNMEGNEGKFGNKVLKVSFN